MDLNLAVRTVALAFPLPRALDLRVFVDYMVAVAVLIDSVREFLALSADGVAVVVVLEVQILVWVPWMFWDVAYVGSFAPTPLSRFPYSLHPCCMSTKL